MHYEEKLIRCIASKLIQRKYYLNKGYFPDERQINKYVEYVLTQLKQKYRQLKYVRNHTEDGLLTPIVKEVVAKIKIV